MATQQQIPGRPSGEVAEVLDTPRNKIRDKSSIRAVRERREAKLLKERRKEKKEETKKKEHARRNEHREDRHRSSDVQGAESCGEAFERSIDRGGTEDNNSAFPPDHGRERSLSERWDAERERGGTGVRAPSSSVSSDKIAGQGEVLTSLPRGGDDALNTELIYFSAALRQLVPELPASRRRRVVVAWLRKLFSPEYHCPSLREKRNRYLMLMVGSLLAGATPGLLMRPPPPGPLPEPHVLSTSPAAAWMRVDPWSLIPNCYKLAGNSGDAGPCALHSSSGEACPRVDKRTSALLDDEFRLLTWLARPHTRDLPDEHTRNAAAAWARLLAAVGPQSCPMLKGMRNDYALALLSQLADGRLHGPLESPPTALSELLPLAEAARRCVGEVTASASCDLAAAPVQGFVRAQPRLDNGAFCYVLVNP